MEKRSESIKRRRQEKLANIKFRKVDILILVMALLGVLGYHHCMHVAEHHQIVIEQQARAWKVKIAK